MEKPNELNPNVRAAIVVVALFCTFLGVLLAALFDELVLQQQVLSRGYVVIDGKTYSIKPADVTVVVRDK